MNIILKFNIIFILFIYFNYLKELLAMETLDIVDERVIFGRT